MNTNAVGGDSLSVNNRHTIKVPSYGTVRNNSSGSGYNNGTNNTTARTRWCGDFHCRKVLYSLVLIGAIISTGFVFYNSRTGTGVLTVSTMVEIANATDAAANRIHINHDHQIINISMRDNNLQQRQVHCAVDTNESVTGMLPFVVPARPDDCDEYHPECVSELPTDYYSPENIVKRSRKHIDSQNISIHGGFSVTTSTTSSTTILQARKIDNLRRLANFFRLFTNCSHPITITVLGGSLTAGRFVGGFDGAWPARLQDRLQRYRDSLCGELLLHHERVDHHIVTVMNHAEPATTTGWALHHLDHLLAERPSDLVIVDYDVNDCALIGNTNTSFIEVQGTTELLIRKILYSTSENNNHNNNNGESSGIIFLNVAVNHRKRPLRGECYMYETCYSMDHIRAPILDAYGIPQVSAKAAIWANFSCAPPPAIWPCTSFCSHPLEMAHELLANITADYIISNVNNNSSTNNNNNNNHHNSQLLRSAKESMCDMGKTSPLLTATTEMNALLCNQTVSYISAYAIYNHTTALSSSSSNNNTLHHHQYDNKRRSHHLQQHMTSIHHHHEAVIVHQDSCWSLMEDAVGKPGWVGLGCIDKSIIFLMKFGPFPSLTVTALSTYPDNTGIIEVSILPLINYTIHSHINQYYWDDRKGSSSFVSLGTTDLQREDNDYKFYSLSSPILFNSRPPRQQYKALFTQFYDQEENELINMLKLSNAYALVRITQVDGNNRKYLSRMKQRNFVPRAEPQKVKIISLQTC